MKTSLLITLLTTLLGLNAHSQEFVLSAGLRSTSATTDQAAAGTTYSVSGKNGFQVGGVGFFPIAGQFNLRTGFLYTQRFLEVTATSTATSKTDVELTYIDIPLTGMYKFNDYGGFFGGVILALNQAKECKSATATTNCAGTASSVIPLTMGFSFKFAPHFGGELSYEMVSGKLADIVSDAKSIGVNLLIYFE
jgi:hypothetical protein